jgi:hypothetical protein
MMVVVTGEPASGEVPGPASGHRRAYRSDPDALTAGQAGQLQVEFDRLARQVYVGVRDGTLDPEAAFDLSCLLMRRDQHDPLVQELAEQSAEGTDRVKISELALQVLTATAFEPGFRGEPARLEALERALEVIEADVRATGLSGPLGLILNDWDDPVQYAHAVFRGGGSGSTVGIHPAAGSDPVQALVAVADDLQNSVMHILWGTVWPVCPAHHLGAHARDHEGAAVWWCNGSGGHVIAAIGKWNG